MLKAELFIDSSNGKGRGVFTNKAIKADTVIEVAPVIVMSAADRLLLDKTLLHDYIFEWGKMKDQCCMALGLVSMYNHSYKSNCEYIMDYETETIAVQTVRKIRQGEELTINYNGDWNDPAKLWFEAD
ncbi:SET domain-containing protein [Ferruginibacter paludis]|uniref:SET domain-containing protein n=1 Tax=Ferruginibacter paludis TaxID=1310417 RepID=UPI0025B4E1C3|nr:SET domain-containing protein [Ferruginibacter paludis]MDN3655785.1 SET domain-containing protein [Ferruginibacter paludis]